MITLTLRTDKPDSELGLYDGDKQLEYFTWPAHRTLSSSILTKLYELLKRNKLKLKDVDGIIVYEGPGSFTGLRIGISVANALAYSLAKPIVSGGGTDWIEHGRNKLEKGIDQKMVKPKYGAEPHITSPRK